MTDHNETQTPNFMELEEMSEELGKARVQIRQLRRQITAAEDGNGLLQKELLYHVARLEETKEQLKVTDAQLEKYETAYTLLRQQVKLRQRILWAALFAGLMNALIGLDGWHIGTFSGVIMGASVWFQNKYGDDSVQMFNGVVSGGFSILAMFMFGAFSGVAADLFVMIYAGFEATQAFGLYLLLGLKGSLSVSVLMLIAHTCTSEDRYKPNVTQQGVDIMIQDTAPSHTSFSSFDNYR